MQLEDLKGKHILSGIEVGSREFEDSWGYKDMRSFVKFTLDGTTYIACEDPSDGYRSYMEELQVVDEDCAVKLPDIEVCCSMRESNVWEENDVLEFIDLGNGEIILAIGTGNTNDYYPYCVMDYCPEKMSCNEGKGC